MDNLRGCDKEGMWIYCVDVIESGDGYNAWI